MLTKLIIRNLKQFDEANIELGSPVVFIGPNDSGKTTALQAIALWDVGLRRWNEKRTSKKGAPEKRPGVTINRKDLIAIPIPEAKLLWRNLRTAILQNQDGTQKTQNVYVDIILEGVSEGKFWRCGFQFYYANEESFYCRPIRTGEPANFTLMEIPVEAIGTKVAFLPPMSGLAAYETRQEQGTINVLLGEGRTAEVLRNLCHRIYIESAERWDKLIHRMQHLFGINLGVPEYIKERGQIIMRYLTKDEIQLDLSSAGRGLLQTLLLLAHLEVNPGSVLLLDEPDAHLEILRQRQIYHVLTEVARERGCQIMIASHSEIILNEAADRDVVVAFVGKPHRIDDRGGNQVMKSLKEIGFDQYYQAEQTGWVLYLEGSTDLAILQAFARILNHPAQFALERPFVHYISNLPSKGRDHFQGLMEAKRDLVGYLLCDRIEKELKPTPQLQERMWKRREIENYLCQRETLLAFAKAQGNEEGSLFASTYVNAMADAISRILPPIALENPNDPWWINTKASDDFLNRVFENYLLRLNLPVSLIRKSHYYNLASFVPKNLIDSEITEVLDGIVAVGNAAHPMSHVS